MSPPHPPIATDRLSWSLGGEVRWGTDPGTRGRAFDRSVGSGLRVVNPADFWSSEADGESASFTARAGSDARVLYSGAVECPVSGTVVRTLIVMMRAHSAGKRGQRPPAYSALKPGTGSDSPGVDRGTRLGPACVEMNHVTAQGHGDREGPGRPRVVAGVESMIRSARGGS